MSATERSFRSNGSQFLEYYCVLLGFSEGRFQIHVSFVLETAYEKLNSQIAKKLRNSSTGKYSLKNYTSLKKEILNIFC